MVPYQMQVFGRTLADGGGTEKQQKG